MRVFPWAGSSETRGGKKKPAEYDGLEVFGRFSMHGKELAPGHYNLLAWSGNFAMAQGNTSASYPLSEHRAARARTLLG